VVARGGAHGGSSAAEVESIGGGAPGAGITGANGVGFGHGPHDGFCTREMIPPLPPSRCKALLRALLAALLRTSAGGGGGGGGRGGQSTATGLDPEVRGNLYAALLAFLQYVRPSRAAQLPSSVLAAARGGKPGTGTNTLTGVAGDVPMGAEDTRGRGRDVTEDAATATAAAAAAQDELEAGTSALIRRDAGALVELLARDVVDGGVDEALRTTALAAIEVPYISTPNS